ncbi:MAG: HAD family hydrolase [Planctomycetota bacterium]
MTDPRDRLRDFHPRHDRFIGIDSDGCVFDAMEIKHKECFCPAFIKHFRLQPVSRYAREVWEFVNLYGATRGTNRFAAVRIALDLLERRSEVTARGFTVPRMQGLRDWLERETRLGGPALHDAVEQTGDADLTRVLAWHREVNERVADMVCGIPPFPGVKPVLERARAHADLMVISQASQDAIDREWTEHGLMPFMDAAAGQELGTKSEHLAMATEGRYPAGHVLVLGDAPGDRAAALANGARFYPIMPGDEAASWQRLEQEVLDRFLDGGFDDALQQELLDAFAAALPEQPPFALS